jgi:hypothetical protein
VIRINLSEVVMAQAIRRKDTWSQNSFLKISDYQLSMAPRLLRGAFLIPLALLVVADLNIVIAASNALRYTKRSRKCFISKPPISLYRSNSFKFLNFSLSHFHVFELLTFLPSYLLLIDPSFFLYRSNSSNYLTFLPSYLLIFYSSVLSPSHLLYLSLLNFYASSFALSGS